MTAGTVVVVVVVVADGDDEGAVPLAGVVLALLPLLFLL